jgi:hypothetical protein
MRTNNVRSRLISLLERGANINPDYAPNHHLLQRRGVWFARLTVDYDGRRSRVHQSLSTSDVEVARVRRDALIDDFIDGGHLVILRPRRE